MRVLFVTPFVPSRIKVRPYSWVRALSAEHEVTVVTPVFSGRDRAFAAELASWCERVIAVPVSRPQRLANYLRGLLGPDPFQALDCDVAALRAAVAAEARAGFDVAHVVHLRAARFVSALPASLPRVWDATDSISLLLGQTARFGPSLALRLAARVELSTTPRFEARMADRFQRVLLVSERDREALEACAPGAAARLRVLPNGVDLEYFRPVAVERDPETVLFSGTMSYHPNVRAAVYLAREVMPLVWRRRPSVRLVVAGADPTPAVRALAADPRIRVTGFVPDLRPLLARAALAVSPTVYGAGIQNKVLEAMAMATPVVASPSSSGGLRAEPGRDYLVAGTAAEIAATIVDGLERPERLRSVGAAGRAYVEREHDWQRLVRELVAEYEVAQAALARDARPAPARVSG